MEYDATFLDEEITNKEDFFTFSDASSISDN